MVHFYPIIYFIRIRGGFRIETPRDPGPDPENPGDFWKKSDPGISGKVPETWIENFAGITKKKYRDFSGYPDKKPPLIRQECLKKIICLIKKHIFLNAYNFNLYNNVIK